VTLWGDISAGGGGRFERAAIGNESYMDAHVIGVEIASTSGCGERGDCAKLIVSVVWLSIIVLTVCCC
jgi:hypothetical protein